MDILLQWVSILLLYSGVSGQIGRRRGRLFSKNSTISLNHQRENQTPIEFAVNTAKLTHNCSGFHTRTDIIRCIGNKRCLRVGFCATYDVTTIHK